MAGDRKFLETDATNLRQLSSLTLEAFDHLDDRSAKAKADSTLQNSEYILFQLFHALNLYSISPTILFDVARLGPQPSRFGPGTQYGVGPAIRFGVVNVEFMVGYCFNVKQNFGQPRGAAVFGLTFNQIF